MQLDLLRISNYNIVCWCLWGPAMHFLAALTCCSRQISCIDPGTGCQPQVGWRQMRLLRKLIKEPSECFCLQSCITWKAVRPPSRGKGKAWKSQAAPNLVPRIGSRWVSGVCDPAATTAVAASRSWPWDRAAPCPSATPTPAGGSPSQPGHRWGFGISTMSHPHGVTEGHHCRNGVCLGIPSGKD